MKSVARNLLTLRWKESGSDQWPLQIALRLALLWSLRSLNLFDKRVCLSTTVINLLTTLIMQRCTWVAKRENRYSDGVCALSSIAVTATSVYSGECEANLIVLLEYYKRERRSGTDCTILVQRSKEGEDRWGPKSSRMNQLGSKVCLEKPEI